VKKCSIPSTHAEREITVRSHKHYFTPFPSLSPFSQMNRITDWGMNTLAAHGLEELFSSCAVVSVFQLWWEIVLGVTYLPYQLCHCVFFLVAAGNSFGLHRSVFWLWREIVLGVTYVSTISVVLLCKLFWLRQEIIFGCTVSKKDSYSVSLIERESAIKCVYFVRSNTLLLCISLLCIYLLYRTEPQTHRLDHFLKFPELSGQVAICRIPSKNTDRKITNLSGKHSFAHSVS
jgi:hypothetical protein